MREEIKFPGKNVASLIKRFVEGQVDDWEWDDFISVKHPNPKIEALRMSVLAVQRRFPASSGDEWCAEEGRRELLKIASAVEF